MISRPAADRSRGFTLLEVLFALVVLGLAMTALIQSFSTGLDGIGRGEQRVIATLHARSKLEEFSARPDLELGEWSGVFDNGFRWQVSKTPAVLDFVASESESEAEGAAPVPPPPEGLNELVVRVVWRRGEIVLRTLRYDGAQR